jgi:BASS family bile acid:Na+ symporter
VYKTLAWIARNGTWLMPLGIVIGCLLQPLAALLRPTLALCVYFMLTIVLSRLDIEQALSHLRNPRVFLVSLVWAFAATPLLFALAVQFLPLSPGLTAVLIIYATSPPNFAAAAMTFLMGLDGALTVATIFAATAFHPVLTPVFTETFAPSALPVSGVDLALRLAGLIGAASVTAWFVRRAMGTARRIKAVPMFDGLNVIIMLVFAIALMDGIPGRIIEQPGYAFALALLAVGLHLGLNLLSSLLFYASGRRRALTLGFTHAGRNIAVVMGVLGSSAPPDAWLFFAMLQIPIYCLPMFLRPFYTRAMGTHVILR